MTDQATAAADTGATNDDLTTTLQEQRDALTEQLEAMGLTKTEATHLADAYGAIPEEIVTTVTADTESADTAIAALTTAIDVMTSANWVVYVHGEYTGLNPGAGKGAPRLSPVANAFGNIISPMAAGGVTGTRMDPVAQMVPPGTFRLVGDRLDVDEAYIPLDGSPRSRALLAEAVRRMPGLHGFEAGGIATAPTIIPQSVSHTTKAPITIENFYGSVDDLEREARIRRANQEGDWPT